MKLEYVHGYDDINFAILWRDMTPSSKELEEIAKQAEVDDHCVVTLQEYIDELDKIIAREAGRWHVFVDLAQVLLHSIVPGEIAVIKTDNGYAVITYQ